MKNILVYAPNPSYAVLDHMLQPKNINFDPAKNIPLYVKIQQDCLTSLSAIESAPENQADIAYALDIVIQAIQIFVFEYKIQNLSKTQAKRQLEKAFKSLKDLNSVVQKTNFALFVYNNFLCIRKHNKYPLTWDEFVQAQSLLKKLQTTMGRLLKKATVKSAHRPTSDNTQKNQINRKLIKSLIDAYIKTTGQNPTYSPTGKFVRFATNILDIINKYFPCLDKGHNTFISISDTTRRLLHLSSGNN